MIMTVDSLVMQTKMFDFDCDVIILIFNLVTAFSSDFIIWAS